MNTLVYTLRDDDQPVNQGPRGGGVYISQSQDGNFVAIHTPNIPRNLGVEMSQYTFAEVFGRVPVRGMDIRADVFIRLCRLGGLVVYFEDTGFPVDVPTPQLPNETRVILRTSCPGNVNPNATGYCLRIHPDGNFRLYTAPLSGISGGLGIDYDRFESMFGSEPRDYFANEVLRIATLGRLALRITTKVAQDD